MDTRSIGVPTYYTRVEAWECDHNDHWNVRNYMRVFQQAGFVCSDMTGRTAGLYPYTQHNRYHRELVQTSPVEIRSATVADGPHAGATVHLLSSNGQLAATSMEQPGHKGLPLVSAADAAAALPRGIDGAPLLHDAADVDPQAKVVEHGILQARELDHTGSLAIDFLMGRISGASNDLLTGMGFTPQFMREAKMSRMGVETKVTIFQPIPLGTRLRSVVRIASAEGKRIVLRHRFFTSGGEHVAAVDQGLVTVDMTTRKATALPDFLLAGAPPKG